MNNLDHIFVIGYPKAIAAVRTNRKGAVLGAFTQDITPKSQAAVMESLAAVILEEHNPYVVVGFNIGSVKNKFNKAFSEDAIWIDAAQLAWPMLLTGVVPSGKFSELCKHFNVANEAPGNATGDCAALTQLYWAMMTRYKTSLLSEEVAREMGGKTLATVRNWLGM